MAKARTQLVRVARVAMICAVLTAVACGTWASDTRTALLTANEAINGYDDVAAELWNDAATNDTSFNRLERSLCIWLTVQDSLVQAWATVSMVEAGMDDKKRLDVNVWVGNAVANLKALEDQLKVWEVPVPSIIYKAFDALQNYVPNTVYTVDPPSDLECAAILSLHEKGSK